MGSTLDGQPFDEEYSAKVAGAVMQAVLDASAVEGGDKPHVRGVEALHALIAVAAKLLAGTPEASTPRGRRLLRDAYAKSFQVEMERYFEPGTSYRA